MDEKAIAHGIAIAAISMTALMALVALGVFLWNRRVWREIDRRIRGGGNRLLPEGPASPSIPPCEPAVVPIQIRSFQEALQEDCPELAPSPQWHVIAQQHAAQRRHHETENNDMKLSHVAATAALTMGVASGCARDTLPPDPASEKAAYIDSLPEEPKEYRRNPHPKEQYELTVTIANAPGPLVVTGSGADFDAQDCRYVTNRWAGSSAYPQASTDLVLTRVDESTYRGTFYRDAMLDEDYDGPQGAMRPCHWKLHEVGPQLRATGTVPGETRFHPSMVWLKDEPMERTVTVYFNKIAYPRMESDDYSSRGQTDRSGFGPGLTDDDLFTVTLTTRKVTP